MSSGTKYLVDVPRLLMLVTVVRFELVLSAGERDALSRSDRESRCTGVSDGDEAMFLPF